MLASDLVQCLFTINLRYSRNTLPLYEFRLAKGIHYLFSIDIYYFKLHLRYILLWQTRGLPILRKHVPAAANLNDTWTASVHAIFLDSDRSLIYHNVTMTFRCLDNLLITPTNVIIQS